MIDKDELGYYKEPNKTVWCDKMTNAPYYTSS